MTKQCLSFTTRSTCVIFIQKLKSRSVNDPDGRRKYLFYRERHHRKLEKGIEEVQDNQRTITESVKSEIIVTDFKTPNINIEETSLDSGNSQTSYASPLIDDDRLIISLSPRDLAGGKSFECSYYFFVIDVKSTRS